MSRLFRVLCLSTCLAVCTTPSRLAVASPHRTSQWPVASSQPAAPLATDSVWRSLGPANIPGSVLSLAFDRSEPQTLYAGAASGGVWKSVDNGASWFPIGDNLPTLAIGAIATSPLVDGTLIAGTGGPLIGYDGLLAVGILRSPDGGATWSTTNVVADPYATRTGYHAIEANESTGVFLAGSMNGLLRSVDDGHTWSAAVPSGNWTDITWRPGSRDSVLAVREYGGVFLSDDGGLNFHQVTTGLPSPSSMGGLGKIAWSRSDPRQVYLQLSAADSFTVLGIYGSTDAGATWELRSKPTYFLGYQGFYNNSIVVDPADPNRVIVGGLSLNVSTDGARTWKYIGRNIHNEHHWVGFNPKIDGEAWIATEGAVYRSTDRGSTWAPRHQGLVTIQFYHSCASSDSTIAYAGAHGNGMPQYTGSMNWTERHGGDGMVCQCDPGDPLHVIGEHQFGSHFVSWDGIATYYDANTGLSGSSRFTAPLDLDARDPQHLVTTTKTGIYGSHDGGLTWSLLTSASDVVSVSISRISRRIWALERSSGLFRTSPDGGLTWTASMAAPFSGIGGTKILADPTDSTAAISAFLYHIANPPRVLRTRDAGVTWQNISGDLGQQSVHTVAIQNASAWYVGTDEGVWKSSDSGAHWARYGFGLPNVLVLDLQFRGESNELRAATYGRGLWSIYASGITGAETTPVVKRTWLRVESGIPASGSVQLRYGSVSGLVLTVRVFSVAGRRVADLVREISDGNAHSIAWRASGVPAGVYFVSLQSGSAHVTRKVVILR